MKTKVLLTYLLTYLLTGSALYSQPNAQTGKSIAKSEAIKIVEDHVIKTGTKVNYYVSEKPILPGTPIKTVDTPVISPDFTSWLIFIDDAPFKSWAHRCRYVFVNVTAGKYIIRDQELPPDMSIMEPVKEQKMKEEGKLFKFEAPKNVCSTDNDYAVIISGGMNKDYNWVRYWNDCAAIYSALTNIYGFSDSHIYVLMSDGTSPGLDRHHYDGSYDSSPLDLDGDGDNDIQYAATKANISTVFTQLSNILGSGDNLFIYTTDHGKQESGQDVKILLWGETMRDDEFAAEVDKVNAGRINVVMEQCFSGGFIDDLQNNNRVITTACKYSEPSNALPDLSYDAFVYYWTAAVAGEYPDGTPVDADYNDDGWVSMSEAFNYANWHDSANETPQYNSTPSDLGAELALHGLIPNISGPSNVCTSYSTFYLQNVPPGSTVTWSSSPGAHITPSSGSGTSATIHLASCGNIGNEKLTFYISSPCGNLQVHKDIIAGGPDPTDVELDIYKSTGQHANKYGSTWVLCPNTTYHIYCVNSSSCTTSNYSWTLPYSLTKNYQYNNMVSVNTNSHPGGNIIVKAQTCCTSCGSNVQILSDYVGTDQGCGYSYMSIAPNPANDEVTLELKTENIADYKSGEVWSLEIYSQQQVLVKTMDNLTDTKQMINTSAMKSGVYYVRVLIGNNMYSGKFVIER